MEPRGSEAGWADRTWVERLRRAWGAMWVRHEPKLLTCVLGERYTRRMMLGDLMAGLTVAVIALPLEVAEQLRSMHPVADAAGKWGCLRRWWAVWWCRCWGGAGCRLRVRRRRLCRSCLRWRRSTVTRGWR